MSTGSFCSYLPSNYRSKGRPVKKRKPKNKVTGSSFISEPAPRALQKKNYTSSSSAGKQEVDHPKVLKIDAAEHTILHIDTQIRSFLSQNISSVSDLQQELRKCLTILHDGEDPSQRILAQRKVSELRKRIKDLESTLELGLYIFRTEDLLEEYRQLLRQEGGGSFIKMDLYEFNKNKARMDVIESNYLRVARDYAIIENVAQKPQKMMCPTCFNIDLTPSDEDDSIFICGMCLTEVEIMDDTPSFKDTDRVNMSSKYTYTKKGHFSNAIKRFQGVQNTEPKKIEHAVSILKNEMIKHNLVEEREMVNSVTKDHLYMFLSEQCLSDRYDDLNLLFHIITGEPCPDISQYEDALFEDFDLLEKAYKEIDDGSRSNSLNVNYKLYKLLQRQGYPCKKDDFYILKTKTKEDEHDEKMRECWEHLGWYPWIPTY